VTYTITNQPSWATFNATTGALAGTPAVANVGTSGNITITANNGTSTATIGPFSIAVTTGSATLTWSAPIDNTNGSPLTDLAGYHVYYGTSATALTTQVSVSGSNSTSYVLGGLTAGTYYFAITAYGSDGTESPQSNVTSKTI
jgi:hypothetical protein